MKIYTEEQVIMAMHLTTLTKETYNEVLKQLTPIELPSDEEIEKKVNEISWIHPYYQKGFFNGIKWMKEQILNQNK